MLCLNHSYIFHNTYYNIFIKIIYSFTVFLYPSVALTFLFPICFCFSLTAAVWKSKLLRHILSKTGQLSHTLENIGMITFQALNAKKKIAISLNKDQFAILRQWTIINHFKMVNVWHILTLGCWIWFDTWGTYKLIITSTYNIFASLLNSFFCTILPFQKYFWCSLFS